MLFEGCTVVVVMVVVATIGFVIVRCSKHRLGPRLWTAPEMRRDGLIPTYNTLRKQKNSNFINKNYFLKGNKDFPIEQAMFLGKKRIDP